MNDHPSFAARRTPRRATVALALAVTIALGIGIAAGSSAAARDRNVDLLIRGVARGHDGRPANQVVIAATGDIETTTLSNADGRYSLLLRLGSAAARARAPLDLAIEARRGGTRLAAPGGPARVEITIAAAAAADSSRRLVARSNLPALAEHLNREFERGGETAFAEIDFGGAPRPAASSTRAAPPPPPARTAAAARESTAVARARTAAAARESTAAARARAAAARESTAAARRAQAPRASAPTAPARSAPLSAEERAAEGFRATAREESLRLVRAAAARARESVHRAEEALRSARRDSARTALRARDSLRRIEGVGEALRAATRRDSVRAAGPAPDSCACRVAGTVEVRSVTPLGSPLDVIVSVRGVADARASVRLFMGSPRGFALERVPCGQHAIEVRTTGSRRWALADSAAVRDVPCVGAGLAQPRVVLIPR